MPGGKISLRGVDIIMSYRESDVARRENLYCVLAHLDLTYEGYTLWLVEADSRPKFDWSRANDAKIRSLFIHNVGPFPKAMLYNLAVRASRAEILCFHDADSIGNPSIMAHCLKVIQTPGEADAVSPFLTVHDVSGRRRDVMLSDPTHNPLSGDQVDPDVNVIYAGANGGITWFRRASYCAIGGYNPNIIGWGGEDDELLCRARRLGRGWNSFHAPLIHLNHGPIERDTQINAHREHFNGQVAATTANMPEPEFQAMVSGLAAYFESPENLAPVPPGV